MWRAVQWISLPSAHSRGWGKIWQGNLSPRLTASPSHSREPGPNSPVSQTLPPASCVPECPRDQISPLLLLHNLPVFPKLNIQPPTPFSQCSSHTQPCHYQNSLLFLTPFLNPPRSKLTMDPIHFISGPFPLAALMPSHFSAPQLLLQFCFFSDLLSSILPQSTSHLQPLLPPQPEAFLFLSIPRSFCPVVRLPAGASTSAVHGWGVHLQPVILPLAIGTCLLPAIYLRTAWYSKTCFAWVRLARYNK